MSIFVDRTFADRLSFQLDQFKQLRTDLYRFRCPLCGDSKKKKSLARGFIYPNPKIAADKLFYKCQNCGVSTTFHALLKEIDNTLYDEYLTEIFAELGRPKRRKTSHIHTQKPKVTPTQKHKEQSPIDNVLSQYQRVCDLHPLHPCKQYVTSRKFPAGVDKILYFVDDFKELAMQLNEVEAKKVWHEPRLVIPYFDFNGDLTMVQGRAIGESAMRYITIKTDDSIQKIYGLERVNRAKSVQVVEGPLDSLFIFNCVAVGDGTLLSCDFGDVYIPDNQPRNKEVVQGYRNIINAGKKVVIWGEDWKFKGKDINDYVINGASLVDLHKYIGSHTYNGLNAELKLATWRKI